MTDCSGKLDLNELIEYVLDPKCRECHCHNVDGHEPYVIDQTHDHSQDDIDYCEVLIILRSIQLEPTPEKSIDHKVVEDHRSQIDDSVN